MGAIRDLGQEMRVRGSLSGFEQRLAGARVLITGGGSGIGRATALKLAECGAQVAVLGLEQAELDALPAEWLRQRVDVRDGAAVRQAVDLVAARFGGLDLLVNSAGVSMWRPLLEMDEAFWDLTFDVNVKGMFLVCQAVARHMIGQKDGLIINVASMSGVKSGMPQAAAYAASKWAVVGFSRNLHLELKPHGVRVACICPGSTRTPLHVHAQTERQDEMLAPEDVADAICFMSAAPKAGHVQLLCMPAMFEDWR
jgi:NAD(P)-dependent dehydrogenase (short-subunit alcohol dehydrogenase family)